MGCNNMATTLGNNFWGATESLKLLLSGAFRQQTTTFCACNNNLAKDLTKAAIYYLKLSRLRCSNLRTVGPVAAVLGCVGYLLGGWRVAIANVERRAWVGKVSTLTLCSSGWRRLPWGPTAAPSVARLPCGVHRRPRCC